MLIFLSSNNSNPSILLINDSLFLLYYSSSPTHLFFYNNYAFYINYMQGERSVGFTYQKNKESVSHIKRIRISQRIGLPFLSKILSGVCSLHHFDTIDHSNHYYYYYCSYYFYSTNSVQPSQLYHVCCLIVLVMIKQYSINFHTDNASVLFF